MLEHPALLLRPWATPDAATVRGRVRTILDAATAEPLGFAAEQPRARGWLSRLARPSLAVHETDDEPLVFTIHPIWSWTPGWEVRDADEHCVGVVNGSSLQDFAGRRVALRVRDTSGPPRFVNGKGEEIATLAVQESEVILRFAENFGGNPFAKMLLLTAALTHRVTA
jgi:hypothetical protein